MTKNNTDIYSSFGVFFYVLKTLGLAAYEFDRKDLEFKTTWNSFLQFTVSILVWTAFACYNLTNLRLEPFDSGVQSKFLDKLWQYQFFLQNLLTVLIVVFNFFQRKNIENFLKLLFNFDQQIDRLEWKYKSKKVEPSPVLILSLTAVIIMLAIYTIVFYCYSENSFFIDVFETFAYTAVLEFFFLLSFQFIVSAWCIKVRLNALLLNIR